MNKSENRREHAGETRHFLYYIFLKDQEDHPMQPNRVAHLLQYLKQVFAEKNQQKGRN